MWIARLTVGVTALAFAATVALVVAAVVAIKGLALVVFMGDFGGWLLPIPFVLIVATYLLRYSAGLLMLRRGHLPAALHYCLPRRTTSLSVGANEAAINRYAAAEAHRLAGQPERALRLLDEAHKAPWRGDIKQLLFAARAEALIDLERREEARAILDALVAHKPSSGARRAVTSAQVRLGAAPSPEGGPRPG